MRREGELALPSACLPSRSEKEIEMAASNVIQFRLAPVPHVIDACPHKTPNREKKSCWDAYQISKSPRSMVGRRFSFVEDICSSSGRFFPDCYYTATVLSFHAGHAQDRSLDYFLLKATDSDDVERVYCHRLRIDPSSTSVLVSNR